MHSAMTQSTAEGEKVALQNREHAEHLAFQKTTNKLRVGVCVWRARQTFLTAGKATHEVGGSAAVDKRSPLHNVFFAGSNIM